MLARVILILAAAFCISASAAPAAARPGPGETPAAASDPARDARIDAQFAAATAKLRGFAAEALGPEAMLAPPPVVPLRKSITALSTTELASLRKGIAQMIAWNSAPHGSANYKRSMVYWANMHSYIGVNNQCSPSSGINYSGMSGLTQQAATTPDELATWCTCQHGTIQFLTWHRMYVYYFEQVLRAASGNPKLMLPYWDYETNGQIPASYRSATYVSGGVTVANPLYVANRNASLAAGGALSASTTSTSNAMSKTSYSPFNSALEQTPHGSVHCATGVANCPSGYMGYVPSAGNDPIFYSHHANIDRLYECWLAVDPATRLPSGSMLSKTFNFIDGSGTLVNSMVGNMLTVQQLGYNYTAGGGCPPKIRLPFRPIYLQVRPYLVFPLADGIKLERGVTTVPIRIAAETRKALTAVQPDSKRAAQPVLVLDGLAYDELPGVMYEVYVQGADGKRVLVGVINFFTQTAPHQGMEGMKGMEDAAPAAAATSFDASAALKALGPNASASLVIVPTTGIADSTPAKAAAQINPRANVRFTGARIEFY
jgi:hypothetical protein